MKTKRILSLFLALMLVVTCMGISAFAVQTPVNYLSPVYNTADTPSSGLKKMDTLSCETYTEINEDQSGEQTWTTGWYVVTGADVKYTNGIVCSGDVKLILKDGAKLTVTDSEPAIRFKDESDTFVVYGQTENTGTLVVQTTLSPMPAFGNSMEADLTVNGGTVSVSGGRVGITVKSFLQNGGSVSVSGSYPLTIDNPVIVNGGVLSATVTSEFSNNAIETDNVIINGGEVTATGGGSSGSGIYVYDGYSVTVGKDMAVAVGTDKNSADEITNKGNFGLELNAYKYIHVYVVSVYLDLEEPDATYLDNKTIDQYYTKTTASETVTNYMVNVSWVSGNMNIKVADAFKWDYANLTWVTDTDKDGVATMDGTTNVRTFTFTNYSPEALKCNVTFAKNASITDDQYTNYTVDATDVALDAVVEGENHTTNSTYLTGSTVDTSKLPKATITCTVNPDLDGFKGATALSTPAVYGTYTITINK